MSTLTSGIRYGYDCNGNFRTNEFVPSPHQVFTTDYFLNSEYDGIVLYHKLGSGKTCTSIMIADELLERGEIEKVYVLSPGSLRINFVQEYCKVCGLSEETLRNDFVFISYNYNIQYGLDEIDFNNSLIIVDEAHNLIRGAKNESVNTFLLYNKILDSNAKVVLLTGTPVIQNEDEIILILKLLTKNRDIYTYNPQNLSGLVSFFPGYSEDYPEVIYNEPIKVFMSEPQNNEYLKYFRYENSIRRNYPKKKDFSTVKEYNEAVTKFILAQNWLRTRRTSNFYYPDNIKYSKDVLTSEDPNGWVNTRSLSNDAMLTYSPKFLAVLLNIMKNFDGKHMVYSFYKTKSGVQILETLLKKCGIPTAIFSGDQTSMNKQRILNTFNSPRNRNGDLIKVILVTEAGGEGITLLETNNMHILESSLPPNKINQAIGRVVRFRSHANLPADKRYVNIWKYWSEPLNGKKGIDEILSTTSLNKSKDIDELLKNFEDFSIENM